jgi:hypothetical protein
MGPKNRYIKKDVSRAEAIEKIEQFNELDELSKLMDGDENIDPDLARMMDSDAGTDANAGPNPLDIDTSDDASPWLRLQVSGVEKPEDKLAAIRKQYPDAQPYGEGNFIFTDESGKVRQFNQESWFPSLGDLAESTPTIAEGLGAILGGAAGGTFGSAAPGPGTVAGAVLGSGVGATGFRGATQDAINWWYGNEDSRTTGEKLTDEVRTIGYNAAGEGVGRAVVAGGKAAISGGKKLLGVPDYSKLSNVVGPADDVAEAIVRRDDLRAIGANPTAGMVAGTPKAAQAEHALIPTLHGDRIQSRINDAFVKQGDEFERIVSGISDKPLTKAEAGASLRTQADALKTAAKAETDRLYTETKSLATAPATVDATDDFMRKLQAERAGLGKWSAKTKGVHADEVLSHAADIVEEARGSGWSFEQLKNARTEIGKMANDTDDVAKKSYLNGLRDALTSDMEATANAAGPDAVASWKKAETAYKDRISPETGFGKGGQGYVLTDPRIDTDRLFDKAFADKSKGGNTIASTRRIVEKSDGGKVAWRNTIAGEIDRMGRNGSGEFSGTQFMREWNKLSPEAKNAAFNGTEFASYRADLDRLARIADNMKKYGRSANHSNTKTHQTVLSKFTPTKIIGAALGLGVDAATTGGMGTMAALSGAAAGAAVEGATNNAQKQTINLLTSPETVKWLTEVPAAQMKKGGIAAHLAKLAKIGTTTSSKALAIEINAFLREMGYDENNE